MLILHIDTATSVCSVALSEGMECVASFESHDGIHHASLLAPMIEQVMQQAGADMRQLAGVTVSAGPGSCTGLRVGVASAKAIAYSLQIPFIPVPTLLALAQAAMQVHASDSYLLPMIDARRMEVYCALFDDQLNAVWPDQATILDEDFVMKLKAMGKSIVICGDGAVKMKGLIEGEAALIIDETIVCNARYLIQPGLERLQMGIYGDVFHFAPAYLKAPNITIPRKVVS